MSASARDGKGNGKQGGRQILRYVQNDIIGAQNDNQQGMDKSTHIRKQCFGWNADGNARLGIRIETPAKGR